MTPIEARFYDGKSSRPHRVEIAQQAPGQLHVRGDGVDFQCALSSARISSRVGNTRRHIYFPDGSQCEIENNDAVDAMLSKAHAGGGGRLLHKWESRIVYAAIAIAITLASLWAGINIGVPALAKQIAFRLPPKTDTLLGQQALASLDHAVCTPTRLSAARQAELKKLFAEMTANIEGAGHYQLELRVSKALGANAIALPSGIVVMTDALVGIADNDNQLIAVLAHELGHLHYRHGLRMLLQNSAPVVLTVAVTGDLSSAMSLVATLPAFVLQSRYSRDFEREADDFAFGYMKSHDIPTMAFADILRRIDKSADASDHVSKYVSTHPATTERIQRFIAGSR